MLTTSPQRDRRQKSSMKPFVGLLNKTLRRDPFFVTVARSEPRLFTRQALRLRYRSPPPPNWRHPGPRWRLRLGYDRKQAALLSSGPSIYYRSYRDYDGALKELEVARQTLAKQSGNP